MKLPRDISGEELSRLLTRYGYRVTRQTGSHLRLTNETNSVEQHLTIPGHNPLKTGTLHGILSDVAENLGIGREELLKQLFGH